MKTHILFFFIAIVIISCKKPPERQCEKFKNGTFTFTSLVDGDSLTTKFTRKEGIEIDYFENKIDTSTVRWINNCEYILKQLHPKNKQEEKSIHIKILTTSDSSYTFEFNTVGDSKKLRGTAYKIE